MPALLLALTLHLLAQPSLDWRAARREAAEREYLAMQMGDRWRCLVLLAAEHTHRKGVEFSAARQWAAACLQSKGNSPRQYANTLVFLAPDKDNLENLFQALADRRAWQKVIDEKKLLNLTENQKEQAIAKIEQATAAIAARVPETWSHLLVPYQSEPGPHGPSWI